MQQAPPPLARPVQAKYAPPLRVAQPGGVNTRSAPAKPVPQSPGRFLGARILQRAAIETEEDKMVSAMEGMKVEWGTASYATMKPFLGKRLPFYNWLFADGPPPTKMNCWESVLYAAFVAGVKDKAYLKKAIAIHESALTLVTAILKNPAAQYKLGTGEKLIDIPSSVVIPKGYVILFSEDGQHVALSTGTSEPISRKDAQTNSGKTTGHGLVELDKSTNGIERSTVEDTMERNSPYRRMVSWGPLPAL